MRFTSLKLDSLRDLYLEELRDLHSAENQLIKALPKMAEASADSQLKQAFLDISNRRKPMPPVSKKSLRR
jgi:ferritin-like metal-binding protein YciE